MNEQRLKSNHRLKHLDVSSNSVGKNENMPTISGSMKSGSLAFGNLLASSTCSLNTLQLSWNMIRRVIWCNTLYYTVYHIRTSIYGILLSSCIARLKGACALSQSLSTNMFLTGMICLTNMFIYLQDIRSNMLILKLLLFSPPRFGFVLQLPAQRWRRNTGKSVAD